jgi:hypothetical protein
MNSVLRSYDVARNARNEIISRVVVTHELNGLGVFFCHRDTEPKLLAWYAQTPSANAVGLIMAAEVCARRIADKLIDSDAQHTTLPEFEQR